MTTELERRAAQMGLSLLELENSVLEVDKIPDEGALYTIALDPEKLDLGELREACSAQLLVHKVGQEISIHAETRTRLEQECGRCLKTFSTPVELKVHSMFLPEDVGKKGKDQDLPGDDIGIRDYKDSEIHLDEFIAEELILTLPHKPLCSPRCPGLCSQCGQDLSEGDCSCQEKPTDARWNKLAELLRTPQETPEEQG